MSERKLALDDIADLRAYERERAEFRDRIIDLKKTRRVPVGPFVTLLFENRDTIRFQVQEMARAEKILSDDGIQAELDVYNPLIPEPGSLTATLFIELTSKDELMEWLPRLVGVEQSVELRLGDQRSNGIEVVTARPDPEHEKQLTRDTITPSVHYLHLDLTAEQVERFGAGPVTVAIAHSNYAYATELGESSRNALVADLVG
jgi:hypothetical protein